MTNFERVTQSREALAAFLGTLPVLDGPWHTDFQKRFCADCPAENCEAENCPHNAERDNPGWWLNQKAADCTKTGAESLCITPDGRSPAAGVRIGQIEGKKGEG